MSLNYTDAIASMTAQRDKLTAAINALSALVDYPDLATDREKQPREPRRPKASRAAVSTGSIRQDDILKALRNAGGVATGKELRAKLKIASDDVGFQNALTQLKGRGVIGRTGSTWSLIDAEAA
jgi:hypothetical protein